MIVPFADRLVTMDGDKKVISYGLSSFGYDVRLSREFKIFSPVRQTVVDPKDFQAECVDGFEGDVCVIPPNSFVLGRTVERFRIPDNVLALCCGKSSYARCGTVINVTPLEPGWSGWVTLEISNTSPLPSKVYADEGIAQVLFFEGDGDPGVTYADRAGKYMNQAEAVQTALV